MKALWNDEHGFVISAELVLVMTIAVLAMIVGLSEVAVAVNTELNDISNAIGSLNQSYVYSGFSSFDEDVPRPAFHTIRIDEGCQRNLEDWPAGTVVEGGIQEAGLIERQSAERTERPAILFHRVGNVRRSYLGYAIR